MTRAEDLPADYSGDVYHRVPAPTIQSLDEPIDESGADDTPLRFHPARQESTETPVEVEPGPSAPVTPVVVVGEDEAEAEDPEVQRRSVAIGHALMLKDLGFSILPLPTGAKAPPPKDWERAAVNKPEVFLTNPGTGNYAVLPPSGCFGLDIDKDAPAVLARLGEDLGYLPETLTTLTPNGMHKVFRWPVEVGAMPTGDLFGIVTRRPLEAKGKGYLVGPGSYVKQDEADSRDGLYRLQPVFEEDEPIATLPRAWAEEALAWKRDADRAGEPVAGGGGGGYVLPREVKAGDRYGAILAFTAHLYNQKVGENEMWEQVQTVLASRFTEPLGHEALYERFLRATKDMPERLGPPMGVADEAVVEARVAEKVGGDVGLDYDGRTFVTVAGTATPQFLVDDFVPDLGLTIISGLPKSLKSMAMTDLAFATLQGRAFMGRATKEVGLVVYAISEMSDSELASRLVKVNAHGDVLDRLRLWRHADLKLAYTDLPRWLALLDRLTRLDSVLLVIDPLRDYLPRGGSEKNDETISEAKEVLRLMLQHRDGLLSIALVHHNTKAQAFGDDRDASGSGAISGMADSLVQWQRGGRRVVLPGEVGGPEPEPVDTDGTFWARGRSFSDQSGKWTWDADSGLFMPTTSTEERDKAWTLLLQRPEGAVLHEMVEVVYGPGAAKTSRRLTGSGSNKHMEAARRFVTAFAERREVGTPPVVRWFWRG